MSSLSHTPRWRRSLDRIPRAKLTINLGDERDNAVSLAELADIARSVQHTIDQMARALNDELGQRRSSLDLERQSALEVVSIDSGTCAFALESPHDMESLSIDFEETDPGVQAIGLFVRSLGAIGRGDVLPKEVDEAAARSLGQFINAVRRHEHVQVESTIAGSVESGDFVPYIVALPGRPDELAPPAEWDFATAMERAKPIKSIHDLAIPGIDEDEADAFWHAVND